MANKTVKLAQPIIGHDGPVGEIELREPKGREYWTLGDPRTWVRSAGGQALVENDQVIQSYIERLIVKPDPVLVLNQIGLRDAIAVKDAVLGFFTSEETAKPETSGSSPTSSSSESGSSTPSPAAS